MRKEEVEWERYKGDKPIMMKHGFELFLRSNCEYSRKRFIYKIAESNEIDFLKKIGAIHSLKISFVLILELILVIGQNF